MKKLFLLGVCGVLCTSAVAQPTEDFKFIKSATQAAASSWASQTTKGSTFIGVNIGNLSYTQSPNSNAVDVTLFPSAGVFLADDFLLVSSITLGYRREKFDNNFQDYIGRTISYGLAPFARYYFAGTTPHRFFGQASVGIARSNSKIEYTSSEKSSRTDKNFAVGLGYNYFLTPGVALEILAGYGRDTNGVNATIGYLDVRAGFSVFLPSK